MTKFEHKADPTLLPGERLLWQGRQWYVSNCGLGAIRTASYPGHWFDRAQIDRGPANYRNPAVPYSMLSHIADKDEPDLDIEDFIEAFQVACHWFHRDLRSGWLHREIAYCRQLRAHSQAREALRDELFPVPPGRGRVWRPSEGLAQEAALVAEMSHRGLPQSPDRPQAV